MKNWSLLWVTDLHYELPTANYVDDPKELDEVQYRENIFKDFNRILKDGWDPKVLDLIGIGGDITTHGKATGFKQFVNEALPLLQLMVTSPEAICLVPGNHDVIWGLDASTPDSLNKKFAEFQKIVEAFGGTSCLFPEGKLGGKWEDTLSLKRPARGPIYLDRKRKLLVLCINSAIRCGELNTRMVAQIAEPARAACTAFDEIPQDKSFNRTTKMFLNKAKSADDRT